MKVFSVAFILCSVLMFSACSQFEPFVDSRREAGQVARIGSSTPDKPVVCYGLVGTQSDFDVLANDECAKKNKKAVFETTESFSCKIFTPQKAVYRCE